MGRNCMQVCILVLLAAWSVNSEAYDDGIIKGSWAIHESSFLGHNAYYFLCINDDFSGVFVRSFRGKTITRAFSPESIFERRGYTEIVLAPGELALVAAWRTGSHGRMGGQVLLYEESGALVNFMQFTLQPVNARHPVLEEPDVIEARDSHCKAPLSG